MSKEELEKYLSITWGKSNREDPTDYHLLIYHLLDSAAVAQVLWDKCFSESIKLELSAICELDISQTGKYLSSIIGLHDIGKASPVFQAKSDYLSKKWESKGITLPKKLTKEIYHAEIGCLFLTEKKLIPEWSAISISGHHGKWNYYLPNKYKVDQYGDSFWDNLRTYLVDLVVQTIGDQLPTISIQNFELENMMAVWLSGVICISDWVSSNQEYFLNKKEFNPDLKKYFYNVYIHAEKVVTKLGWKSWKPDGSFVSFQEMYSSIGIVNPRPIQKNIIDQFEKWNENLDPFLLVIEAPTGIGKTEIALYLADKWLQAVKGNGLYIAMPTMATSNMIFERCTKIFSNRYKNHTPDQFINVVLAHGQAGWNDEINQIRLKEIGDFETENFTIAAMDWFQNNRKRSLLAPFGIGTVDQVFLAVLQTKHFFVRMTGLKNKVIIFDEVHAYDVYMNTLFYRLLAWLRTMGASVIVLSATLPNKTRSSILSSFSGVNTASIVENDFYPLASFATSKKSANYLNLTPYRPKPGKVVKINWINENMLAREVISKLERGGCAAIICNTVRKAQVIYKELKEQAIDDIILFHAQYPMAWRREKEKIIFSAFGKESTIENGTRPVRAIVIATQVIEQSLDIDFDVIFSELAPVDLIIQRIGRLHRHNRTRNNPFLALEPQFYIFELPRDNNDFPDVTKREKFYDKSILLKSYYVLKQSEKLQIDEITKQYIEQVYGDIDIPGLPEIMIEKIDQYLDNEINQKRLSEMKAKASIIPDSKDEDFLYVTLMDLKDDENMEFKDAFHAQTRDFTPSLQCICVFQEGEKYFVANREEGIKEISIRSLLEDNPPIRDLIESSMSISNRKAINQTLQYEPPFPLPKNLRLYKLIIFSNNGFGDFDLDQELGFFEKDQAQ